MITRTVSGCGQFSKRRCYRTSSGSRRSSVGQRDNAWPVQGRGKMLRSTIGHSGVLLKVVFLAPLAGSIAACGGVQLSFQTNPHSVDLSWTASTSTDVVGYNIYRALAATGPFQKLNTIPISETTYTDTTVQSGVTYYYVATAVDSIGVESSYSNVARATVP
jgi:hypothetical protein